LDWGNAAEVATASSESPNNCCVSKHAMKKNKEVESLNKMWRKLGERTRDANARLHKHLTDLWGGFRIDKDVDERRETLANDRYAEAKQEIAKIKQELAAIRAGLSKKGIRK